MLERTTHERNNQDRKEKMTDSKYKQHQKENLKNHVMSQNDVACILNISKQAVQVTEQRALKKIKEKLSSLYSEEDIINYLNQNTFRKNLP